MPIALAGGKKVRCQWPDEVNDGAAGPFVRSRLVAMGKWPTESISLSTFLLACLIFFVTALTLFLNTGEKIFISAAASIEI